MTSERPRFPAGLTLAAVAAVAIAAALGVWQLHRLDWKQRELARVAALRTAPAQPIAAVLTRAAHGGDVEFTRVAADCMPGPAAPPAWRLTTDAGQWVARALAPCRLAGAPFDGVIIDRGYLTSSRGATTTPTTALPPPVHVVGVLFPGRDLPRTGLAHPAAQILDVEAETPPPPGVTPSPYAANAADNLEYAGAYAPTWFGLAGVIACVYAAMLWRRYHPKR